MQTDSTQTAWYAMSATYRSELITAAQLRQRGIECYLPLQLVEREHRGKKIKVRIPLIGNLLFIHSTRRTIQLVKQEMPRLQYKMFREKNCPPLPIIVPDRDMQNFIRATGGYAGVKVSALDDSCIPQGSRVRVNGGPMDGLEGTLVKNLRNRNHSIVVSLDRLCSVQLVIPSSMVELIPAE
ncbi:MAG: UpxY family transcription antiterminator [Bacteroidaceae bacterium]|nr:UpxY family transcription antiterminator [Bacteroidaceae bacterium]